jgi:hypothetical protein
MTDITTPSGIIIPCEKIDENDRHLGHFVTYRKRYWDTQMEDYGTSTCPKADEYIDDHNLAWKEQAERSKTKDNDTEGGDSDEGRHMSEEIDVLETRQMEKGRLSRVVPSLSVRKQQTRRRRDVGGVSVPDEQGIKIAFIIVTLSGWRVIWRGCYSI